MNAALKSYTIDDDLIIQENGAVEVTAVLEDGRRRWCYFITPAALSRCGDWLGGTPIRFHHGAPHMIVVAAELNRAIIEGVLRQIDQNGDLERWTLPLGH